MAAPVGKMRRVSDGSSSSSSSDEEVLRRCQEAVWESKPAGLKDAGSRDAPKSRRVVVAEHEHDGNELKVSQGFRTHVAKKLESLLDSCISETQMKSTSCVDAAGGGGGGEEDVDDGFRLFSTSVPGRRAEEPHATARRRPPSSSSDSDSEMELRLREAAVSVADLLPARERRPPQEVAEGKEEEEEKKKKRKVTEGAAGPWRNGEDKRLSDQVVLEEQVEEGAEPKVKQKKKKKKVAEGDSGSSMMDVQRNGGNHRLSQEEEGAGLKVKQKKKKKRKEATAEDKSASEH